MSIKDADTMDTKAAAIGAAATKGINPSIISEFAPTTSILAYKNTGSRAGPILRHNINPKHVERANVWFDSNCNAYYGLHMTNGNTYLSPSVGAMNGVSVFRTEVSRLKDLL